MDITEHINPNLCIPCRFIPGANSMRDIMRHKIDAPQPGCHALIFILL